MQEVPETEIQLLEASLQGNSKTQQRPRVGPGENSSGKQSLQTAKYCCIECLKLMAHLIKLQHDSRGSILLDCRSRMFSGRGCNMVRAQEHHFAPGGMLQHHLVPAVLLLHDFLCYSTTSLFPRYSYRQRTRYCDVMSTVWIGFGDEEGAQKRHVVEPQRLWHVTGTYIGMARG